MEAAVAALSERLTSLSAQVQQHEGSLNLVADVARYGPLRDLLAAGRFQEADAETAKVLFESINTTLEDVTPEEIATFPAGPLRIIDQLWRSHSDGRFGFRVQETLYRSLGGTLDTLIAQDLDLYRAFCERVGWRPHEGSGGPDDSDDPAAMPVGALPRRCWFSSYGMKITNLLMARLITAGLGA
ncbi:MAG: hypothetical protein ER33_00850 [Cyanobium sp. CACIAM 14]|nr:MAG: hypothetical protein ER33_00850 [Cyanobium sp. CACIAM 14]